MSPRDLEYYCVFCCEATRRVLFGLDADKCDRRFLESYSIKKSMFDVGICLVFGLIGWMFKKYDYPSSPLVLGLVLGKLIETNYIQTLMVTGPIGFVQRPLTVILFIISIVAIIYPIVGPKLKERKKNRK